MSADAPRDVLFRQASFNAWASTDGSRKMLLLLGVTLGLIAAMSVFAAAVMGPRLVREGSLLWFGTHATGIVDSSAAKRVGLFKDGAPKYKLTIDYSFIADGRAYSGSTKRTDVRTPPDLAPGDRTGVYYDPANPANSVAEHNLRSDVYALALFLPFLVLLGFGSGLLYAVRLWRWKRHVRAVQGPASNPPKAPPPKKPAYVRAPTVKPASRR